LSIFLKGCVGKKKTAIATYFPIKSIHTTIDKEGKGRGKGQAKIKKRGNAECNGECKERGLVWYDTGICAIHMKNGGAPTTNPAVFAVALKDSVYC